MAEDVLPTEATGPGGAPGAPAIASPLAGSGTSEGTYQALYRRYRPQRFADVRGQEHVTRALRNAVREGRVVHAYLFSGPRGTGKTSTARILAMALNCSAPVDGEPDGTCTSCRAIRAGASMDVFELDAASNRKLDEMRDLLSRVALGTPGRWKVYIIDEVHQLTPDAASALLKTLEEPPGHVVFVLATTDPQKVLATILSRTQHFEFRLLDGDVLTELLDDVNRDANLGLSPETIKVAVEKGRGSARDAESALEQLAAGGEEDGASWLPELVTALAQRDAGLTLEAVARAASSGKEPRRLANDLVEHLRNAFLASQAPSLVLLPAAATADLAGVARDMGLPFLVRTMETVGQALVDMRDSVDPRVTLEVALIRLASPAAGSSPSALLERIERLERAVGDKPRPAPEQKTGPAGPSPAGPSPASPALAGAGAAGPSMASSGPTASATVPPPAPSSTPAPVPPGAPGPAQARVALGAYLAAPSSAAGAAAVPGLPAPLAATPARGPAPAGRPPGGAPLPSRDELTKAWGDTVLAKLPRTAQVYMANGRFTEVDDLAAVFALPGPGLVSRATNFLAEAQEALAAHFGRPVPLRLTLDKGVAAVSQPAGAPSDVGEEEELEDPRDLAEATDIPSVPVEQRILQAFPGAVLDG